MNITLPLILVSSAWCIGLSGNQTAYATKTGKEKKISFKRINVKKTGKNRNEWTITSHRLFEPYKDYDRVSITKHTRAGRGLLVPKNGEYNICISHAGAVANGNFTITKEEAPQLKSLSINDEGDIQEIRALREKKPEKPAKDDAKPSDKLEEKKPDVKNE